MKLPAGWRRWSTDKLRRLRDDLEAAVMVKDDLSDSTEIDDYDDAIDRISEELDLRRSEEYMPEPVDTDEQDRRAASEERIENHWRER